MPMTPARLPLLSLLALLLPLGARAFSVPDHEAMTRASVDAVLAGGAYPGLAAHRAAIVEGSRAEDLNLHVKWTGYHHFFHPGTSLDSGFRKDSGTRVRVLWAEAEEAASHGDLARAFDRVGHLVHHIQDMAVPLHVVPVMHGLSDRFEQHAARQAVLQEGRELAPLTGEEAQLALAQETLKVVRTGSLPVEGGAIPWSAFWSEPGTHAPGAFGVYGAVGNAFDSKEVRWQGRTWKVEPSAYDDFVDARVESAVAYSRAFLRYAAQRLTTLAEAREQAAKPQWQPSPVLGLEVLGGAVTTLRGAVPVAGLRALFPLPWAFGLSASFARALAHPLVGGSRANAWSLSVLSPPLLTGRLGYSRGLELRASVGAGMCSQAGQLAPELPLGLRLQTMLSRRVSLSAEAQYRAFAPHTSPWAQGVTFTLGTGFTWGDN
ncbi:hypothetical protein ATI61_103740 [Archangium gephyra]|uniref:Phospholipase C/D domain-containing protein n=1 Tax=Archangium gephyra TaxID=48 RepID=A0AAC8Q6Z6_9BACT|nr:hypothetical protein [Archangium gephyra]AKJ02024.1 Hypothetical protein AA314_03650 [Archangium gephyra]REG34829.1 hypothetical protein ATI61_103740 [Archangium gephyra]